MDPLQMLREYTKNNRLDAITITGERVSFGDDYDFPKAIPTAYRSQQGQGDFYVLETLVVFLKNLALTHPLYMRKTAQEKIPAVTFQDRKTLIDYLQGRVNESASIQYTDEVNRATATGKRQRGPADDSSTEPAAKLAKAGDRDGKASAADTAHERQLRTRQTMLLVPNKDFRSVLAIFKVAETAARKQIEAMPSAPSKPRQPSANAALPKSSGRLERGPAPAPKAIKDLGINIYGKDAQPSSRKPDPSRSVSASARHHESASLRRPSGAHGEQRRPEKGGSAKAPPSKSDRVPIILVPEGLSAIVNLYNAKMFLEDAKFETVEEAQKAQAKNPEQDGVKPEPFVMTRTVQDRPVKFFVTDKVPSESDSAKWTRVVAVVCLGKKWQFKGFPFRGAKEGALVETFASVCGIFFHWKDQEVPDVVKTWNVKTFPIARSARHHDVTQVSQMFDTIRKFLDNKSKSGVTSGCKPERLQYK